MSAPQPPKAFVPISEGIPLHPEYAKWFQVLYLYIASLEARIKALEP